MKRNIIRLLALILLCMMCLPAARADEPLYRSYAYTPDGYSFFMQTPYEPVGIVGQYLYAQDGSQLKGLNAPSDMSLSVDGTLYIADRGNKRIVQMNLDGDYGIPVPDYVEEKVSTKVVKIIQSYTGVVDKMVWRKF